MSQIACTGNDDCPICRLFGEITAKPKMVFNVLDKSDGTVKQMVMDESRFNEMFGKVQPKGRCLSLRVWKFEVRFWWMWRGLLWRDKRSGTTSDCQFWMFGPWEFRKYW